MATLKNFKIKDVSVIETFVLYKIPCVNSDAFRNCHVNSHENGRKNIQSKLLTAVNKWMSDVNHCVILTWDSYPMRHH